jgi:TetR/AcrR family transcriptional repressor of nem operon
MNKINARDRLLDAGLRVMFRLGYAGTGVREVVAEAGVAQGSFTNHFRSKEQFAAEVLERYFIHVRALVALALEDEKVPPRQRLRHYLEIITGRLEADHWQRGCLIGDFSIEMPGQSEDFRARLADIYATWRQPFARCIRAAQADGSIASDFAPEDLADFLLSSWQGAMLRMKVERTPRPLELFKKIAFATVFKEP